MDRIELKAFLTAELLWSKYVHTSVPPQTKHSDSKIQEIILIQL